MILLDTHIWIWWVHSDTALSKAHASLIEASQQTGIAISAISCWEIAKLVELKRLILPYPLTQWMSKALSYPGLRLIDLTPDISIESTTLPGIFHKDPADQIIVATARVLNVPLVTVDSKILAYPHVTLAS